MVISAPILSLFFDLTTILFGSVFLLFSLCALACIFHFRVTTRNSQHLRDFNALWPVRTLLVIFVALWALNEILRLPFLLLHRLHFFSRLLPLTNQANLCKIHVVLSLGLFQPGFLATILYLVNVSVLNKRNVTGNFINFSKTGLSIMTVCCLPIFLFQILFVFFPSTSSTSSSSSGITEALNRSFVINTDEVVCAYPLLSSICFGAFGGLYALSFLASSWRVISVVINKGLRRRTYALTWAVLLALPTQIIFLGVSVLWNPDDPVFHGLALVAFLCMLACAVVCVFILVIKPIRDALAFSGQTCPWTTSPDGGNELDVGLPT